MHISFSTSNEIRGHCIDHADDSNREAVSDIRGSWEEKGEVDQGMVINFTKTFWGGQKSVDYQGKLTQDFKRIIAHWAPQWAPQWAAIPPAIPSSTPQGILSRHHFEMDFENKLDTVWRCSQECTFDCCTGCMEKYTVKFCYFLDA